MAGLELQKFRGQAPAVLIIPAEEFECFPTQTTHFQVSCRDCIKTSLLLFS